MEATEWQAEQFEQNRGHLRAVAQRMLGSAAEADDAVQEAWLRLSRSDTAQVENMRGWLTTVVSRICLDMLRARQSRREDLVDEWSHDPGRRAVRRGRGRSRARGADRRRRRAGAAGRARDAVAGRATLVRAARHVRRPVRGDRPDHRAQPRGGSPAREPGEAPGQERRRAGGAEPRSAAQGRRRVPGRVARRRLRRAARGARSGRRVPGRRRHDRPAGPGRAHRCQSGWQGWFSRAARRPRPSAGRRSSTAEPARTWRSPIA